MRIALCEIDFLRIALCEIEFFGIALCQIDFFGIALCQIEFFGIALVKLTFLGLHFFKLTFWVHFAFRVVLDAVGILLELKKVLNRMGLANVLLISDEVSENLYLSARNLPCVDVRDVDHIDPVSLIAYKKVLMTVDAIKVVEEAYA